MPRARNAQSKKASSARRLPATQGIGAGSSSKSFGRPSPVVCPDDDSPWFETAPASAEVVTSQAQAYIRTRFSGLLPEGDIEKLVSNQVMLDIIATHRQTFVDNKGTAEAA